VRLVMISADLPPQDQEWVVCSITAAVRYEVPANIVLAVVEKEGGRPGQRVRNPNGTYDVGPLQFNTAYLKELRPYGITAADVEQSGCYPYALAAWRLRSIFSMIEGISGPASPITTHVPRHTMPDTE